MSQLGNPFHWDGHWGPQLSVSPECQGIRRSESTALVRGFPVKFIAWFMYHAHPKAVWELTPQCNSIHFCTQASVNRSPPSWVSVWSVSDCSSFITHSCLKPALRISSVPPWLPPSPLLPLLLEKMNLCAFTADAQACKHSAWHPQPQQSF